MKPAATLTCIILLTLIYLAAACVAGRPVPFPAEAEETPSAGYNLKPTAPSHAAQEVSR